MSQLIPAALRAPQTAPAVQGAQRPAAPRSGDDFARALRQETGDRSTSPARASERPTSRDDRRDIRRDDRSDVRNDVRRADRRDVRGGERSGDRIGDRSGDRRGVAGSGSAAATSATSAAGQPGDSALAQAGASPVAADLPVNLMAGVPVGLVGVLGAPGETGPVTDADVDAGTAASAPFAGVTGALPVLQGLTPDQGGTQLAAGVGHGAPVLSAQPALGAAVAGAAVVDAAVAGVAERGSVPGATASVLATSDQVSPAASGATAAVPVRPGENALVVLPLAPGAPGAAGTVAGAVVDVAPVPVAAIATAPGGAAGDPDGGAAGAGRAPVTEIATPGASTSAPHGAVFAQTLSGVAGAERVAATAAAGPAAQASLAEQVRGPVLALRTAAPGEHVLTLKVTPENLGPVQVRAHIGAEGIRIELVGATDAAREGLRGLLTDLRRDLAGTGMNASLSLGADSGPGGRAGQGAAGDLGSTGDGSAQARPGRSTGTGATAAAREQHAGPAVPSTPTSSGAHGVDILT